MKKMIFAAAMIVAGAMGAASTAQAGASITGAGATFPYPVYSKWADTYNKETDVRLNYQSIGSGGGVKQIKAKTVDFGASDAPMKPADLNKFGLIQWPMVMGGVVPVVNIAGVASGQLKLSAENMADIFLGNIRYWNDKKIQANNPDLKLPEQGITVVHRSDGSGTTWIFTNYLSKISNNWKDNVGNNKSVQWPVGLGGKGNEGVAAYVKRIDGSIGYVEYAYALQNQMTAALLQNQAGNYVAPTAANFQAAAAGADWAHAEGYYMVLTAQPGANSWPITGASFILMYKSQDNAAQAKEVLKFFEYSFKNGSQAAMDLDYVPMPEAVVKMVEATWASELKDTSGKAIWK